MHVDGFRFDLASALARELKAVDKLGAFFDIIHQDPVISQVKLIAEPWDLGEGGYQVGNFPVLWTEWNGKYRDSVRKFWKGDGGVVSEFASRLCGSSDLYAHSGRRPYASINFITCHDGFNLHDLVSYNEKHNEANGEENRDGANHNESWNCGAEGPTEDPAIIAVRDRQRRNFIATLMMSQGVAMLLAGDELSHTQRGNNNTYCQDNELTWLDWDLTPEKQEFLDFVKRVIRIWQTQPVLQRRKFFQGRPIRGSGVKDITWFEPSGEEMTDEAWGMHHVRCLAVRLAGDEMVESDEHGKEIHGDTLLILLNAHHESVNFTLPADHGHPWERILGTAIGEDDSIFAEQGAALSVEGRSLQVFRLHLEDTKGEVGKDLGQARGSTAGNAPPGKQIPPAAPGRAGRDDSVLPKTAHRRKANPRR
jgi:glycogen operon protein